VLYDRVVGSNKIGNIMKLDIAQTLMIVLAAAIAAIYVGFVSGYVWGTHDGQFSQHCTDLGGKVLDDGTCGHFYTSHIDAGTP